MMKPSVRSGLALGFFLGAALASAALHAQPKAPEISIFSLNDFHGHLQPSAPVPALVRALAAGQPPRRTGGLAHVQGLLKQLRERQPHSLLVGAGDMIGASPADSSLLEDQPAIESLNRLGLSLTSLGNHEMDSGAGFLQSLLRGDCAPSCKLPGFAGAKFEYLAANVKTIDGKTPPWLKPYAVRMIGGHRVAFIGAVTKQTPRFVPPRHTQGLVFEDEATAINRVLPEVRALNPAAIVVVMHEGAEVPATLPPQSVAPAPAAGDCATLRGAGLEIARKVDADVKAFFMGHSHQTYACELEGRFLVQGGAHGAHVSEIRFAVDAQGRLQPVATALHITAHDAVQADAASAAFVAQVQSLTSEIKNEVVGHLQAPLLRTTFPGFGDSPLGRWIADGFLQAAESFGGADLAFTNVTGLRGSLAETAPPTPQGLAVTRAEMMGVLPFRNELVRLVITGAQLKQVLVAQTDANDPSRVRILQPSSNFSYRFDRSKPPAQRVSELRLNGKPIEDHANYRVVFNSHTADGGDNIAVLRSITDRTPLGLLDIDAAIASLKRSAPDFKLLQTGRVEMP